MTSREFKRPTSSSIANLPVSSENLQSRSPSSLSGLCGFRGLVASLASCRKLSLSDVGSSGLFLIAAACVSASNSLARVGMEALRSTLGSSVGSAGKGWDRLTFTGPAGTRESAPMNQRDREDDATDVSTSQDSRIRQAAEKLTRPILFVSRISLPFWLNCAGRGNAILKLVVIRRPGPVTGTGTSKNQMSHL
jgi:hypothetical protein